MKRSKNSASNLSSAKTDASNSSKQDGSSSRLVSLSSSGSASSHASSSRNSPASDASASTATSASKSQPGPFEALRQAFLEPMNKQKQQKERSKDLTGVPFNRPDGHSPFNKLQKTDPYEFNVKNEDKGSVISSNKKIKPSKVAFRFLK